MPKERKRRTPRAMHPVVQQLVTTSEPLPAILRRAKDAASPLCGALLALQECLSRQRLARQAIEAARAVPMAEADPDLLILMLSSWAELSCRLTRPSEAQTLLQRAQAMLSSQTAPEIRSHLLRSESILADSTGDRARQQQRLDDALRILPQASPRTMMLLWEKALFLCQQGRGADADADLRWLSDHTDEFFTATRPLCARFVHMMETGHHQEASLVLHQLERQPDADAFLTTSPYHGYRDLLQVVVSRAREDAPQPPPTPSAVWLRVIQQLLADAPEEALALARLDANRLLRSIVGSGLESFNMVRAELAQGNADAARRLLSMRHARGNRHYLDDLFLARAEHLEGNLPLSRELYANCVDQAEHFRARGRLAFELEMACELSRGDVAELAHTPEDRSSTPGARRSRRPRPDEASEATSPATGVERIVGRSREADDVRRLIEQVADTEATILVTGDTGTGKELVARALHETSTRASKPFVAVNCGAIAENLLESELFGHRRGAFTGAENAHKGLFREAADGALFLDEIGEIPPRLQRALLRVLETNEVRAVGSATTSRIRCRIIAATNADLAALADEGHFRRDLMFRLQRLGIHLPRLRDRPDDIPPLSRHFLDMGRRHGIHATLSPPLAAALRAYDWPGNVRELRNVVERMRLLHSDKLSYTLEDLDLKLRSAPSAPTQPPLTSGAPPGPLPGGPLPATPDDEAGALHRLLSGGSSQLRRRERLRDLFATHHNLTRMEVATVLRVSPNTATKDLNALIQEGVIRRVEPSASTRSHYFTLRADDT